VSTPAQPKPPKKPKDPRQTGSFEIRMRRSKQQERIVHKIKTYLHIKNMQILLCDKYSEDKELRGLLLNPVVMKGVYANTTGGVKTREKIAFVKEKLRDEPLLKAIQKLVGSKVNSHNVSMVTRRVLGEYRTFWTNLKKGEKAAPPGVKKLRRMNHFALPLERDKWSLKRRNTLRLTLGSKGVIIDLPHTGIIESVGTENITGLSLFYSNGDLYFSFTYKKPTLKTDLAKIKNKKIAKTFKTAGLDIGINNIFSIFVDDDKTESLVMDGAMYKHYNTSYNKFNAKIASEIELEKDADRAQYLRGIKQHRGEKRRRFFKSEWEKLSSNVVDYLVQSGVKQLVISKNLSFAKQEGEIKMRKKDKQKFYIMPFARLLNLIEAKCLAHGISVVLIDEAYTSKTSCLSGSVVENQSKRERGEKPCAKDFNGSRAKGIFKDTVLKIAFHSDINGAANHIAVALGNLKTNIEECLFKLCSPLKFKSANEFSRFVKACDATIGSVGSPTLQV